MKRGRNQRRRQGVNINRALDSNGPDVRIRGTANQIYDKYLALARDATSSGDRVKAENYLQHAEHYFRLIRSIQPSMPMNNDSMDADGDQPMVGDNHQSQDRQQDRPHDNRHQDRREQRRNDQNGNGYDARSQAAGEDEEPESSPNGAPQLLDDGNDSEAGAPRPPQQPRPQARPRRESGEGGEGPARRRRRPRRPAPEGEASPAEERDEEPVVDAAE